MDHTRDGLQTTTTKFCILCGVRVRRCLWGRAPSTRRTNGGLAEDRNRNVTREPHGGPRRSKSAFCQRRLGVWCHGMKRQHASNVSEQEISFARYRAWRPVRRAKAHLTARIPLDRPPLRVRNPQACPQLAKLTPEPARAGSRGLSASDGGGQQKAAALHGQASPSPEKKLGGWRLKAALASDP